MKSILLYFEETNGEYNLFLNNYIAEHPIKVDATNATEDWLVELAAQPFTRISVRIWCHCNFVMLASDCTVANQTIRTATSYFGSE